MYFIYSLKAHFFEFFCKVFLNDVQEVPQSGNFGAILAGGLI
jgi:hypothetical protein